MTKEASFEGVPLIMALGRLEHGYGASLLSLCGQYISPSRNLVVRGNAAYGLRDIVPTVLFVRNPRATLALSFDSVVFYYMTDTYGFLRALDVSSSVLTPMQQ